METQRYYQQNSKPAVWFIAVFVGFLGLLCLVAFLDRMPHLGGDDLALLAFAAVFFGFTFLFLRFSLKPTFVLTERELLVRRFFGTLRWKYEEITAFSFYEKKFFVRDGKGRKTLDTLITGNLILEIRTGKQKHLTLPGFVDNKGIISSLEQRTGTKVEILPMVDKTKPAGPS